MPRQKTLRQKEILRIIEEKAISTQEELVAELQKRGFRASQATLSKDIRELGLVKVPTADGGYRYTAEFRSQIETPRAVLIRRFHECVTDFELAGAIVVVRTIPGYAPSIAYEIDRSNWEEVTGTIAGDDTIFIACPSQKEARALEKRLQELMESLPSASGQQAA